MLTTNIICPKVHTLVAKTSGELLAKIRADFMGEKAPELSAETIRRLAGHQLCRRVGQPGAFAQDMDLMLANGLPFDADCVDERLVTTAFEVLGLKRNTTFSSKVKSLVFVKSFRCRGKKYVTFFYLGKI
jgi:hypothetical protein